MLRKSTHRAFDLAILRLWLYRTPDRCRCDNDRSSAPNNGRPVKIRRSRGRLDARSLRRTRSSHPRKLIPPVVYRMPRSPTRTTPLFNKAIRIPVPLNNRTIDSARRSVSTLPLFSNDDRRNRVDKLDATTTLALVDVVVTPSSGNRTLREIETGTTAKARAIPIYVHRICSRISKCRGQIGFSFPIYS